jgi:hypothetical protein
VRTIFLVASLTLFTQVDAAAIQCIPELATAKGKAQAARSVFVARVETARLVEGADDESTLVEATYAILEVLKGEPSPLGSVRSSGGMNRIRLAPGDTYIFFVSDRGTVSFCGGSRRLDWYGHFRQGGSYGAEEKSLIDAVRTLSAPTAQHLSDPPVVNRHTPLVRPV